MDKKFKKKILIVDDTPENIDVLKEVLITDYSVKAALNGQVALKIANKDNPDLILLDVMMPGMDGFEVCEKLKSDPQTAHIPIIFVTAKTEEVDENKGFDVGAVDYIRKPITPSVVLRRVETHLSLVQAEQLKELAKAAIRMLGEAGHYNDTDTGHHIWRMAEYAKALAMAAGASREYAEIVELAAPMHDTGKIGIPDSVLKAPRKLTGDEWELMKEHARIGSDILSHSTNPVFKIAAEIAMSHHEKWDGSGYPSGLKGDDIPWTARVVAIADVFDALTMRRPYKEPWPVEEAMAEIRKSAGNHFDPELVATFCKIQDEICDIKDGWDKKD
ncbi:response regulator [Terasakiella sp. A23]|uniref:response regulator n=1 Tax=Terasakiella sp. FCG-A23 TaxID=3080561 RepID=UPI0029558D08|nr:HD domain-containing phosphohydrolase [Terasakiella sp. A23]MDV7340668.1 response regulator [Terasakiella sp. A23]